MGTWFRMEPPNAQKSKAKNSLISWLERSVKQQPECTVFILSLRRESSTFLSCSLDLLAFILTGGIRFALPPSKDQFGAEVSSSRNHDTLLPKADHIASMGT